MCIRDRPYRRRVEHPEGAEGVSEYLKKFPVHFFVNREFFTSLCNINDSEIRHGWELTCDHGELDVITGSFARAAAMAKSDQSLDELGAELAALAAMIEHMPVRTAPLIENIIDVYKRQGLTGGGPAQRHEAGAALYQALLQYRNAVPLFGSAASGCPISASVFQSSTSRFQSNTPRF